MEALREDGHTVIAIGPPDNYVERVKAHCDFYVPLRKLKADGKNPLEDFSLLWEFRKIIRRYRIEMAFTFTAKPNIYFSLAARGTSARTIPTVNGLGNVFVNKTRLTEVMTGLYRIAFRKCEKVIFQNPDDRVFFRKQGVISASQGMETAGSGVNLLRFPYVPPSRERRSLRFLFSARLVKEKGIYEFLEAAKIIKADHPEVIFKVIGMVAQNPSSLREEEIRKFAADDLIVYESHTDHMDVELQEADVVVLPSYYREGVPRVLLEGLSTGRPIVTTDSIGCRETVVDGQNGYLVKPKNIESLVAAMKKVIALSDEQILAQGRNSRQLAEQIFDETVVVNLYRKIAK